MINQQRIDSNKVDLEAQRFGANANTCVFTISGNHVKMGVINNVNTAITPLMGYDKNLVIDKNIEIIQPKIWAENHTWMMHRYFNTLEERVVEKERIIMCCTDNQFLKTVTIYVKILPKLEFGLEIIGFFNPLPMPGTYAIFVDMHDGMLLGVCKSCYENFGIPTKFVYGFAQEGTEMNIDQICPELIDLHSSGEIANPGGNVVTFDTTLLAKNYYLAEDEGSKSDDDVLQDEAIGSK